MDEKRTRVWSTADLPPAEQFAYWREMICHSFVSLTPSLREAHVTPATEPPGFIGSVEQRPLGALTRSHIHARAQQTRRTRHDVARGDGEFYFLNVQLRGECRAEQNGEQVILAPGDHVILDTRSPYTLDFPHDWSMLSYRLPASWLDPYRSTTTASLAPTQRGAVDRLLASTVRGLWDVETGPEAGALARSLSSLISAAWAAASAPKEQELLRRRILDRMTENLSDAGTTVASIAASLHLSVRTLHAAFEGTDTTASQVLRQLRMARAQTLLGEGQPAAAVGRAVGYPHPSSFARAFKATMGYPPSLGPDAASAQQEIGRSPRS